MKTNRFNKIRFALITLVLIAASTAYAKAQMNYQTSHLFLGQKPTFTPSTAMPGIMLGPHFGIKFHDNGLNIWRPFPAPNFADNLMYIDQTGKVGIGRRPVTHALEVVGKVWTSDGVLIASDERLKRNIKNIGENKNNHLGKLMRLSGKTYEKQVQSGANNAKIVAQKVAEGEIPASEQQAALQALNQTKKDVYKQEFGFLAQDVKALFPELVEENEEGIYAVNYTGLIPVLLEAIKDLSAQLDKLEQQKPKTKALSIEEFDAVNTMSIDEKEEFLSQNVPNPITETATISYALPERATSATISFYTINGHLAKSIPLDVSTKAGQITVSSFDFASGLHIYTLTVNGEVIASKKMVNQ
jgi:hypothetical protein